MKKRFFLSLKNIAIFASVAICCWCAYLKIQGFTDGEGKTVLMYAAGISMDEKDEEVKTKTQDSEMNIANHGEVENPEMTIMMEKDGIVPFHENDLPIQEQEPDPNRKSLPVEEIKANGGKQIEEFYVKDTTGSGTDLAAELLLDPSINLKLDGSVEVLLYHTHTSESYQEKSNGFYYSDEATRSLNQEMNVVSVGEEMKKSLEKAGIGVIHDTTVNDTMYNGSYSRSWDVIQNSINENPGIQVTIDIHRDSMTTEEGVKYKPTSSIDGRKAAQIMLIAGCDKYEEMDFPDWKDNLHMALRVQQKATEMYPELMRPLNFSNSKYNMNATKGSMLVEVGTEVNTIAEAKYSGQLIGNAIAEVLKAGK